MLRRRTKIKSSKRKLKPFRRFDEINMDTGMSSYERFIGFLLVCCFLTIIIYGVLAICGIDH